MKFEANTINAISNNLAKELIKGKTADLETIWKSNIRKAKKEYKPSSIRVIVANVRKIIQNSKVTHAKKFRLIGGEKTIKIAGTSTKVKTFGICIADIKTIRETKKVKRLGYERNINNIREIKLSALEQAIKRAETTCNTSQDAKELAVAIALLTGRRFTEILKTANFKKSENETLSFTGQLKKKGSEKNKAFNILAIGDRDAILKGLKTLRTILDTTKDTEKEVNTHYQRGFDRIAKLVLIKNFGIENGCFHDFRRIYAREICRRNPNAPQRELLKINLGHDNTATSEHYENIRIVE